jgi:hypothetical protein
VIAGRALASPNNTDLAIVNQSNIRNDSNSGANIAELSKDCFNRILMWKSALFTAISNLKVAEHIWATQVVDADAREYCDFELAGMPSNASVPLTAWRALTESAVVL